jgi:hypothetical protein
MGTPALFVDIKQPIQLKKFKLLDEFLRYDLN